MPVEPRVPRYTIAAVALAAYGLWMYLSGALGWQHIGLLPLVWACLAPRARARRFVRDWWPMVLFWLS